MKITSDDLKNGVWDDSISHLTCGKNESPQLSIEPVNGAVSYAVYMLDPDGHDWEHWAGIGSETEIMHGDNPGSYVGPYPPSGTHRYIIYVFALKKEIYDLPGSFDAPGNRIEEIRHVLGPLTLDEGSLTGTFTRRKGVI